MKRITVLALLLVLSPTALADELNEEGICKYNGSSWHDVECSHKRFNAAEEALNIRYKELMSRLNAAISKEPERLKELKIKYIHAQRAWIAFREKECSAFEAWYTKGTLHKAYYYDCMKNMAYQRINAFGHFANPGK